MHLTEHEKSRLLVYVAAELARRRRDNGVKLNYPETKAVIADEMLEAARAGCSYEEVLAVGRNSLAANETMDGIPSMIDLIQVEANFPEGTKLVTLTDPFESD